MPQNRPARVILHTSDLHIADDEASMRTLATVVDIAHEEQVDMVIVAGDLFDHDRVSEATTRRVVDELSRLDQPTVIIPGNHDAIDATSIYLRVNLGDAGPHIFFAEDPAGCELLFEELSVAVWARGIEDHTPANRPLHGFRPSDKRFWRIAVAHGYYVAAGQDSYRSSQIHADEIAALDCDYLALGHVHRFWDVSAGGVTASYSGSASLDAIPGVNLVRFDSEFGVRIDRRLLEKATA